MNVGVGFMPPPGNDPPQNPRMQEDEELRVRLERQAQEALRQTEEQARIQIEKARRDAALQDEANYPTKNNVNFTEIRYAFLFAYSRFKRLDNIDITAFTINLEPGTVRDEEFAWWLAVTNAKYHYAMGLITREEFIKQIEAAEEALALAIVAPLPALPPPVSPQEAVASSKYQVLFPISADPGEGTSFFFALDYICSRLKYNFSNYVHKYKAKSLQELQYPNVASEIMMALLDAYQYMSAIGPIPPIDVILQGQYQCTHPLSMPLLKLAVSNLKVDDVEKMRRGHDHWGVNTRMRNTVHYKVGLIPVVRQAVLLFLRDPSARISIP